MKYFFISTIMAMSAMCVNAQIETAPKPLPNSLDGIDEGFRYNPEVGYVVSCTTVGEDENNDGIITIRVYDENLDIKKTINPTDYPESIWVYNYNNNSDDYEITLTQTLFNDDEKFEYILLQEDKDNENRRYYKSLQVISEDGTILQTLEFPNKVYGGTVKLVLIGNSRYLAFGEYEGEDDFYCLNMYKINKSADPSKVSIASAPKRVSVSPRIASRNQDINVVAEGNGVREVIVTNAAGQVVYSTKVAAGETNVKISSSRLSSGLNVVSVKGADGKEENCKVIVKK